MQVPVRVLLLAALVMPALHSAARAATYYVDPDTGQDSNSGASQAGAWRTVAEVNGRSFAPGDRVLFKRGGVWEESLSVSSSGACGSPITFGAYGSGAAPLLRRLTTYGDETVFEDITVDRAKASGDAVRVLSATNCVLRRLTIRNGTSDGVDADKADGLLIDSCLIHHFLAGSFTDQADAHGVVTTDTRGLVIRKTEIHHVTGDSFQTDPDRDTNTPDAILIEDCHFWTAPLAQDFNSLWLAGQRPGENAIDTKMVTSAWDGVTRCRITLRNIVAHGWMQDAYIANKAAFNMKEKIEAVFDGVTVYDCEIAFRLRGARGNADTTLANAVVYDCETSIRAEDDLSNLKLYNNTFGNNIGTYFQWAGGSGGVGTWDVRNNAFMGSKPSIASHSSNKAVTRSDFVNADARDYHVDSDCALVDAGVPLSAVTQDRDRVSRPQGAAYDVGAYEYEDSGPPPDTTPPAPPGGLMVQVSE
ncbi:MAG: right-handed parallel beta-helix repeat-containing protein [Kiritimatiellae bacterium]|nr:right-handed parallel beta-helix repeat-containing protein [Kiritimatiellia bacterium]